MDLRTKRQKLNAMANQVVSPNEAEVAKNLLKKLGPEKTSQISMRIIVNGIEYIITGDGFRITIR